MASMRTPILRRAGAIVVAVALGLGLVGCSARTANESAGALPPVISETYDLEGARFEINAEQPLVINVSDPTEWKGHVEDPSVAEFVPGTDDGMAQYNPSFQALGSGSTEAQLTAPNGETYEFTIVVP